ncbi:MAG: hypothetical protein JW929_02955 [Anaerolineales bacterium]|nr:hypothetical protein [Anaerolineales bacterium]
MQYQHPEWKNRYQRDAARRRIGWAVAGSLAAAAAFLLLTRWNLPVPASRPSTPRSIDPVQTVMPSPESAARAFLEGWQARDYKRMYSLLSPTSREAVAAEDFAAAYQDAAFQTTLGSLEFAILDAEMTPNDARVDFEITLHTVLLGDLSRRTRLLLAGRDGAWTVAWDRQTILPELENGNRLMLHREYPARGNIYDREGLPLAAEAEVVEIGIIPGDLTDEDAVLARLSAVMKVPRETIRMKYAEALPDSYVPIGEADAVDIPGGPEALDALDGVQTASATRRYYYGGGVGSHVVGYTGKIPQQALEGYQSRGYSGGETVGVAGLEFTAENDLAGTPGATLWLTAADGTFLKNLAETPLRPAMDVNTTLDRDLQAQIERTVLGSYNGAVAVLDRDTGEVLAMASSKAFDSNLFTPGSLNGSYLVGGILADPDSPLLNRAARGLYPLGSVFKIITMAAALESGLFTANSVYDDATGTYIGADGVLRTDWTVERELEPHGELTFEQCLVQSCNPCFWHAGETLWNQDPQRLTEMAEGFGLGSATGIPGVNENPGYVPGPETGETSVTDALNLAVGQGGLQVTPLQVADFVAAVGNGGVLYRPQVILSIGPADGKPVYSFAPAVRGALPVSAANLEVIRRAMRGVVSDPKGTARPRFVGISQVIKIAGKTGTAESGRPDEPHSWFAAYTFTEGSKPDIAVAVIAEYAGEGSTHAARMVRRVMEIYFFGRPSTLYPWEADYGLRATDTPTVTEEPPATLIPEGSE